MESLINQKTCILCKVISKNCEDDHQEDKWNESEDEDVTFLFRILLEIPPKPGISLVVDGNLINADHLLLLKSNLVRWCDKCSIGINQARKLYQQIKEATEKFRKIQRKIVETLQRCIINDDSSNNDKVENYKAIWRKLCLHNEGRFNNFGYPFPVQDWITLVPSRDPTPETSSYHGNIDNEDQDNLSFKTEQDVKDEVDDDEEEELELPSTKQQRTILIFPEDEDTDINEKYCDDSSLSSEMSPDQNNESDNDEDDPLAENFKEEPDSESNQSQDNPQEKEDPSQYYCLICTKSLKTKYSLIAHNKRYHSGSNKSPIPTNFQCTDPSCQKYFKNHPVLRGHIRRFHPHLPVPSKQKLSTFHKMYPELHSKIVKNPDSNLFSCPYSTDAPNCSITTTRKTAMEKHILYKHLKQPGLYKCTWGDEGCTQTFSYRNNYRSHMDRHRGTPKWKCDQGQCDKQFYDKSLLISHKQREHDNGKNEKSTKCRIKGATRNKPVKKVTTEKKTTDPALPPPPSQKGNLNTCEICGKSVTNLKQHNEFIHLNERKFMCHLCPNSFKTGPSLKLHLKRHAGTFGGKSGQRKNKCSVKGCQFTYARNEQLESHMKRRHGGEDGEKGVEFKCQYCGKGFYMKKYLKEHEETHENEGKDPYKCQVCGKGFRTMSYLRYHQKHTHKMKLEDLRNIVTKYK